jgi:hypothetical protein
MEVPMRALAPVSLLLALLASPTALASGCQILSWCVGDVVYGVGAPAAVDCGHYHLRCRTDVQPDPQDPNLCWQRAYCG